VRGYTLRLAGNEFELKLMSEKTKNSELFSKVRAVTVALP
jgi:hypothetical protein